MKAVIMSVNSRHTLVQVSGGGPVVGLTMRGCSSGVFISG